MKFGGKADLILLMAVWHVPIFVEGGNQPLELYKEPPHTLSRHSPFTFLIHSTRRRSSSKTPLVSLEYRECARWRIGEEPDVSASLRLVLRRVRIT